MVLLNDGAAERRRFLVGAQRIVRLKLPLTWPESLG